MLPTLVGSGYPLSWQSIASPGTATACYVQRDKPSERELVRAGSEIGGLTPHWPIAGTTPCRPTAACRSTRAPDAEKRIVLSTPALAVIAVLSITSKARRYKGLRTYQLPTRLEALPHQAVWYPP